MRRISKELKGWWLTVFTNYEQWQCTKMTYVTPFMFIMAIEYLQQNIIADSHYTHTKDT